jgi:hypothetical protein
MIDEQGHGHEHEHEHEDEGDESLELELDTQSQIFLQMREQNVELLRLAAQVAGYAGGHGPLKPNDIQQAMRSIWDVYAEFYEWVDPEQTEDDEEGDEEE